MYTVMITGGLGSGKSTLRELLCDRGAVSIDLDEVSRSLLCGDEGYKAALVDRFGASILGDDGQVVPSRLAALAFADEDSTQALDEIAHPFIVEAAERLILAEECSPLSDSSVLIVEVPLLDKVPDLALLADEVIAVVASSDVRLQRAVARGMDAVDALRRIQVQATDAARLFLADTVCKNEGSLEDLQAWADDWWATTLEVVRARRV